MSGLNKYSSISLAQVATDLSPLKKACISKPVKISLFSLTLNKAFITFLKHLKLWFKLAEWQVTVVTKIVFFPTLGACNPVRPAHSIAMSSVQRYIHWWCNQHLPPFPLWAAQCQAAGIPRPAQWERLETACARWVSGLHPAKALLNSQLSACRDDKHVLTPYVSWLNSFWKWHLIQLC